MLSEQDFKSHDVFGTFTIVYSLQAEFPIELLEGDATPQRKKVGRSCQAKRFAKRWPLVDEFQRFGSPDDQFEGRFETFR